MTVLNLQNSEGSLSVGQLYQFMTSCTVILTTLRQAAAIFKDIQVDVSSCLKKEKERKKTYYVFFFWKVHFSFSKTFRRVIHSFVAKKMASLQSEHSHTCSAFSSNNSERASQAAETLQAFASIFVVDFLLICRKSES